MSKTTVTILSCGILLGSAVSFSAHALPLSSALTKTTDSEVTLVAGGCGIGWHRGPYGYCRRNGVYYGPPAVVYAPPVVVAPQVCPYGGYWVGRSWQCY
jgi:hypothetical protein